MVISRTYSILTPLSGDIYKAHIVSRRRQFHDYRNVVTLITTNVLQTYTLHLKMPFISFISHSFFENILI